MADWIQNMDADVVLLQEVDFGSKRSHFIQELDYLSRKCGLLYRSKEISWDAPYVPYPGLKPSHQFGKICSGGGIISRFPIHPIFSEHLPKPRENSAIYNWFYLSRYLQIVETAGVRFCNLHLEAFSPDNRELHQVKLQNRLIDYDIHLAGGDFNGSIELSNEILEKYEAHAAPRPTFPSVDATQTLDGFILKKNHFKIIQLKTLDTGSVSDHFPVFLELESSSALR